LQAGRGTVFLGVKIFRINAVTLRLLFASVIHLCGLYFTVLGPRLFLPSLVWFWSSSFIFRLHYYYYL